MRLQVDDKAVVNIRVEFVSHRTKAISDSRDRHGTGAAERVIHHLSGIAGCGENPSPYVIRLCKRVVEFFCDSTTGRSINAGRLDLSENRSRFAADHCKLHGLREIVVRCGIAASAEIHLVPDERTIFTNNEACGACDFD